MTFGACVFGMATGYGIHVVRPILWRYIMDKRAAKKLARKQENLVKLLQDGKVGQNLILQVMDIQDKMVEAFVRASMAEPAQRIDNTVQECKDLLDKMKVKAGEASKKVAIEIE